ncbi:hypothetical protein TWF506_008428 [Arthrobotrys conoides]|uniref:Uncharacterized protein n=1 Tax=Arthrobotrys conoides TaxID=74498 RepID=A0AAN8NNB7_9PEZI
MAAAVQWRPARVLALTIGLGVIILLFNFNLLDRDPVVVVGDKRISLKKEKGKPFAVDPLMKMTGPPEGILYGPGQAERVNATLLSLVRNEELEGILQAMDDLERTFNSKFNYPWTFINDVPFTKNFMEATKAKTQAKVYYEVIPKEHWEVPAWINPDLMAASAAMLEQQGVQYSGMKSYHQMCRWNSGMFYKHPALLKYKWYWRVEPKVHFFCDIDYDVFRYMQDYNKTYGFVINIYDSPQSITSLWPSVEEFMAEHPEYIHPNNAMKWLTDAENRPEHNKDANGYSTCHFWSNFEIADMDFWRSKKYEDFFNHLDRAGGFFYERWGDAPVHSVALGLMEDKDKIHWFHDIGYQHIPYFNCPNSDKCKGCEAGRFTDGQGLDQEDCRINWFKYAHMN